MGLKASKISRETPGNKGLTDSPSDLLEAETQKQPRSKKDLTT